MRHLSLLFLRLDIALSSSDLVLLETSGILAEELNNLKHSGHFTLNELIERLKCFQHLLK